MRILAIDAAAKTGWAVTPEVSGVWNVDYKNGESRGMRWVRLRARIKEVCEAYGIEMIVYEGAAGRYKDDLLASGGFIATIEKLALDQNIQYTSYKPTEVKKHATGKGNAKKTMMVEAAQRAWPEVEIEDDNHADALWLLDLAKNDLKL